VGKLTIESSPEIAASCHSILEFCKRQYNATLAKSIKECNLSREIQEKRRQSSIVTNQAKRALQYFKAVNLKRQGMTQKEIASELNCTQASISIMLKKNTSEECLSFLTAYVKKHRFSKIQRHVAIMREIKEILSLLKITLDELLFESSENGSVENIEKSSYFALELTVLEECLSRKHFRRINHARGDPLIRAG
jgi:transcriptional regulator